MANHKKSNKVPVQKTFYTKAYYVDESTFAAFYNFAILTLYRDGKVDRALLVKLGVIIGTEFLDSYLLASLAQSSGAGDFVAKFAIVQAVSFGLGVAKEYLYSDAVTQHATPNANNNFVAMWGRSNSKDENYKKLLTNFYSESSAGTYQFGNVGRGILNSASKLLISIINLLRGSVKEFVAISSYILLTGIVSFLLNKKIFSLFKKVKTLDSEIKLAPLADNGTEEIVEDFKKKLQDQQKSENEMQLLKAGISVITIFQDVLSSRRGLQNLEILLLKSEKKEAEQTNLKFNEGTTFVSWVNANAFRVVDLLHRVTSTNKVLQSFFKYFSKEEVAKPSNNTTAFRKAKNHNSIAQHSLHSQDSATSKDPKGNKGGYAPAFALKTTLERRASNQVCER